MMSAEGVGAKLRLRSFDEPILGIRRGAFDSLKP